MFCPKNQRRTKTTCSSADDATAPIEPATGTFRFFFKHDILNYTNNNILKVVYVRDMHSATIFSMNKYGNKHGESYKDHPPQTDANVLRVVPRSVSKYSPVYCIIIC